MFVRLAPARSAWAIVAPVVAVTLLLGPGLGTVPPAGTDVGPDRSMTVGLVSAMASEVGAWREGPRSAVPDAPSDDAGAGASALPTPATGSLSIVLSLDFSNQSRLDRLLAKLASPVPADRPAFLTAAEFDEEFGGNPGIYRAAVAFLRSYGVSDLATYRDRATISFTAPVAAVESIFGARIAEFSGPTGTYLAPVGPVDLPVPLARSVAQVEGLGTGPSATGTPLADGAISVAGRVAPTAGPAPAASGYPAPAQLGSAQIEYAPDLQVGYDENGLFAQFGDPTTESIALLTGAGEYTGSPTTTGCGVLPTDRDVGGWDPSDPGAYFAKELPSGEPVPEIVGVPLLGATANGCLASWDSTGAVAATTTELETIGATAPGATIYGVYAPNLTRAVLDTEFATVLSPGTNVSSKIAAGLGNVTVIATGYGFADGNDTSWYESLEEAQARGISVLAATGDSSDNPKSAEWAGSAAEAPASMAFNDFGTVAVGGTTVRLDPSTLAIAQQVDWNVSAGDTAQGGPKGTAGGPSEVFPVPSWQKASSAGTLIGNLGRGVPDVSALANDTAATVTLDGVQYLAGNASTVGGRFFNASGTGVAVAVVAGEFATIDRALSTDGDPTIGFADLAIYPLGNAQYAALPTGYPHGSVVTDSYDYALPTTPFRDIVSGIDGRPADPWRAGFGYDLLTGWGSIDVTNFTSYLLSPTDEPSLGPLSAVESFVNVSGLGVAPGEVGASVQQNLFVANSLGVPIIWIQSVLYLAPKASGSWTVNFTAWVVYPNFGLYPTESVYTYWFPLTGRTEAIPQAWELSASLDAASPSWASTITFGFGNGVGPFTLAAPGGVYLMGGAKATYDWQGTSYTDGPRGAATDVPGFLSPQIGLYGYPGGGVARFTAGTAGTIAAYVKPVGADAFEPAHTSASVTLANTQTGETAANLSYTEVTPNEWAFGYSPGSAEQGLSLSVPARYAADFAQTGAPAGTTWEIAIAGGPHQSANAATGSVSISLQNGSYAWTATTSDANYTASPTNGTVTVDGGVADVVLSIVPRLDSVTFEASGAMKFPFAWTVTITGGPVLSGSDPTLETNLTYAKYAYKITWTNASWTPSHGSGTFTIGNDPVAVAVDFALVTFVVKITPVFGVGKPVAWTVTVGGSSVSGHATHTLDFSLPNGTYPFSVSGLPSGYRASPSSGTITVHGSPAPKLLITIIAPSAFGLFGLGIYGYVLVGGAVAAAVALVLLVRRRRRRKTAAVAAAAKGAPAPARKGEPTGPDPRAERRPRDRSPGRSRADRPGRRSNVDAPRPRRTYVDPDEL